MDGDDTFESEVVQSACALYRDFRSMFLWFGFALILAVASLRIAEKGGELIAGFAGLVAFLKVIDGVLSSWMGLGRRRRRKQEPGGSDDT